MDLRHLHHFNMLAETGSLHRAAHRLGLRQPALSQSIRALEADIGARLVERGPTRSHLTQAGHLFLNEIRPILAALDRAVQITRLTDKSSVPLRLGIADDVATSRLVATLQGFQRSFPNNSVIVGDGSATQHRSMLDRGLLDLAFAPADAEANNDTSTPLWWEDLHLVLPASHPLLVNDVIGIDPLMDVPLILGSGDRLSAPDRILTAACRRAGIEPSVIPATCHLQIRLMLVAAGFGSITLPASSPVLATTADIVSRPLDPPLRMMVVAVWPTTGLIQEARRFIDLAQSFAGGTSITTPLP